MFSYPFDMSEEGIFALVRRIVGQYREYESSRINTEVKRRIRFHCYRTTSDLAVAALRLGPRWFKVYLSAVAPDGRRYSAEIEVMLQ